MIKARMEKPIIVAMVLFFMAVFSIYFFNSLDSASLSNQFSSWGIYARNIQNFTILVKEGGKISEYDTTDLTAKQGNEILNIKKVTNLDEDVANRYVNDKKSQLEGVFEPYRSPYLEVLTKTITCLQKFRPVYSESVHKNNTVVYYMLYASERLTFGVCSDDLIRYKAILAFTYCKNTRDLYHLEYFIPTQEYDEIAEETIRSFSC